MRIRIDPNLEIPVSSAADAATIKRDVLARRARAMIEIEWPTWAQLNALDGLYGPDALAEFRALRDSVRARVATARAAIDAVLADATLDEAAKVAAIDAVSLVEA